ncbi:MAG: hypothetical protein WA936_03610 [Erythrobacter sp.]|uniref:hypothetical protein n=1 Tax=Erythrobacter sp. TaxID=1042 RepID=UPI003C77E521
MFAIAATGIVGAQILGIEAWSRADGAERARLLFWIGLALLIASLAVAFAYWGAALGLSIALLSVSLVAYCYRFAPALKNVGLGRSMIGKAAYRRRQTATKASRGGKLGLTMRLVSAGPLYLVAALAVGAVLATKLPWIEVNRLMFGGLVIPLVWAAGALHATADLSIRRVLAVPTGLTALFAGVYFVL